ncbi:MAG: HAD family hydrolase [Acutalibacteraceae bacterium]
MKADAIMFDKDGTLIDFDAFWVPVSMKAIKDVLKHLHREDIPVEEFLTAFGVHNGIADINGVLCKGTYAQMGKIVYDILQKHGCDVPCYDIIMLTENAYNTNSNAGNIKPISPDLVLVLTELKKRHKKLAVITTDNAFITRKCLKALGVEELFDVLYTADGTLPTKPDPACALDFCKTFGVDREHVVMVGDTMTDAAFAKNAEIAMIGIAKNEQNRHALESHACAVISTLSDLLDLLE